LDVKLTCAKLALALSANVMALAVLNIVLSIVSSLSSKHCGKSVATAAQSISR